MAWAREELQGGAAKELLLEVFLLVFQDSVPHITVISFGFRLFLFVVFGDHVQMHRMGLNNFQLGLTLGAIQNLALFHFVLIEINLDGAFRAAHHNRAS
jgi:hypothetical protein